MLHIIGTTKKTVCGSCSIAVHHCASIAFAVIVAVAIVALDGISYGELQLPFDLQMIRLGSANKKLGFGW